MRVLLVGALAELSAHYSYAHSFERAFRARGDDVLVYNYRQDHHVIMNQKIKYCAYRYKPDLIFVLKGERLYASTIRWLKKRSAAYVVLFYPDNPFTLWNGNSNIEVLKALPLYDEWLIWSEQLIDLLKAAGAQRVSYFPFGFDDELFYPAKQREHQEKRYELSFVGSWDPDRELFLRAFLKLQPEIPFYLWGNGWGDHLDEKTRARCYQGAACYFNELLTILHGSAISLNMIRRQNLDAHNMRTCEVPATKSFLLTQRTREQAERLFIEDKEIVCFSSIEEFHERALFYLDHQSDRERVAAAGHEKVQQYRLKNLLQKWCESRA